MKKFKAVFRGGKDGKHLQNGIVSSATINVHDDEVGQGPSLPDIPTATFPEGIKELHRCDDAVVDICFVHGLTGDREETWMVKSQQASWPQLLLPHRLKHARILTWGYDAYLVHRGVSSSNRLIDHATNLVNDLIADRAEHDASSRSLIFVAHSLGGLVCKMAIMTSRDSPTPHLKRIFTYIKGIVFMGTPHSGSWMADWAKIPVWGLGVLKSTNRSLLSILQTEDQLLESLQISFLSMIRDLRDNHQRHIEVTCFFEELPLPVVGKVVSKVSATFADHPVMSIYANHSDMVKFATVDDNGFKRLAGELVRWEQELSAHINAGGSVPQQRPSAVDPVRNVHWTVMRSINNLFVGRDVILTTIEESLRRALQDVNAIGQQRFVITGMGGQGKSEVCLQLAHRVRRLFWGIFWVDVSTESLAESGFLDIAGRLQVPARTLEEARQGLANVQHAWLLVLDNADDPDVDYQRYFPAGSWGVVMLTSRNDECHQYATEKAFTLDGLSNDEARELLLRAACVPHAQRSTAEGDAQVVVSLLSSHPLALIQAGSYVSRGHCTLAEYPRVFAQQRKRLLAFRPAQARSRYRDVYATFEASAEILRASAEIISPSSTTESARDALQLLPVLATCGPSRLPLPVFEAGWKGAQKIGPDQADEDDDALRLTLWHGSHLPSFIQAGADAWDSFRLIEAVYLCKAFALVSIDNHDGFLCVSMHPLIHAWARDRADATEQHEAWLATGCLMAASCSDHELWRQRGRQLQPHLQALTLWETSRMFASEPLVKITRILVDCGWLLYDMRDDARLFVLMNNLLAHLNLEQWKVEERWLPVYELTARNLVHYGKVKEAVSLLEQVVKIQEQTLAEDHPSRLASQHELAGAYRANGQVKEAVSLLEQVVKIKEQTLAEDHPSRLASQHALAGAYRANGQVKEAVSLLEQVVKIEEQILAEDHPSRLASQHELAGAYEANGQVKEAVSLLEQVVKIQEQTLAEDHPSRLASQHALAGAYRANGQVKKAVSLLEQVVKIREQTLAEDHPSRLASQHELAGAYRANGQVKKAVSLLEQVVKIQEQTLAEDHPSRLASQHELAGAYRANGQVKEAVSLLEQVVKIREQTLVEDHPSRLASQHALAGAYEANGQVKEAVSLLEQVVKIEEQILAEDHPSRLASQHALAGAYQANGQVKEAVSLLEQVVKIEEQTLAEDHLSRLVSLQVLATVYWDLGRHHSAVQTMKHVVGIRSQVLDEQHPDRKNSEAWLKYFKDELRKLEPT